MSNTFIFKNDNNVSVKLIKHNFSKGFTIRKEEVMFRRINTYLIKNKLINGNIIDLGAWIGDNTIPWAINLKHIIYAIDPSPSNINFIQLMSKANNIQNIITIQKAISEKNQILGTNQHINHCTFSDNGLDYSKKNKGLAP